MEPGFFQISLKVFLRAGDRFLVLKDRVSQAGDLPGGRIGRAEFYGDWLACVRRELGEELGPDVAYTLQAEPLFVFPHFILSARRDALGVAYLGHFHGGRIQLSDEHDHFEWVPLQTYEPEGFFPEHLATAVRRFQQEAGREIAPGHA